MRPGRLLFLFSGYWQPVKVNVDAVTGWPGVTATVVVRNGGEQNAAPAALGLNACASTV